MDETKIHRIIMDALKAANAKCDSDGSTIWIDAGQDHTFAICVNECLPDDYGQGDADKHLYSVSLHATFAGSFDVKASSEDEAEEMIRERFQNEDIKDCDLDHDSTEVHATEVV